MKVADYYDLSGQEVAIAFLIGVAVAWSTGNWWVLLWLPWAIIAVYLIWQVAIDMVFPPKREK